MQVSLRQRKKIWVNRKRSRNREGTFSSGVEIRWWWWTLGWIGRQSKTTTPYLFLSFILLSAPMTTASTASINNSIPLGHLLPPPELLSWFGKRNMSSINLLFTQQTLAQMHRHTQALTQIRRRSSCSVQCAVVDSDRCICYCSRSSPSINSQLNCPTVQQPLQWKLLANLILLAVTHTICTSKCAPSDDDACCTLNWRKLMRQFFAHSAI